MSRLAATSTPISPTVLFLSLAILEKDIREKIRHLLYDATISEKTNRQRFTKLTHEKEISCTCSALNCERYHGARINGISQRTNPVTVGSAFLRAEKIIATPISTPTWCSRYKSERHYYKDDNLGGGKCECGTVQPPKKEKPETYAHWINLADVCLTDWERAPRDVVPFGYRNGKGELLTTPKPLPAPLPNAEQYQLLSVPNIRLKSSAKTEKGIARFKARASKAWTERKNQFQVWRFILKQHCVSNVLPAPPHILQDCDFCSQCGSSFFKRRGYKIICYDCGWKKFEPYFYPENNNDLGNVKPAESAPLRETRKGGHNREKWLATVRTHFNPLGKKWGEVTADDKLDVTNSPDFPQTVGEYGIKFSAVKVKTEAEELDLNPNTLSQRISRGELKQPYYDVDFSKTFGKYFCIVALNGRNRLHILGNADAPLMDVLKAFFAEWEKSETSAIKQARKSAKAEGVTQRTAQKWGREAAERIQDAYDVPIELVVPDAEGFGFTHYYFVSDELLKAALRAASAEAAFQTLKGEQGVLQTIS